MLGSKFDHICPICQTPYRLTGQLHRPTESQYEAMELRFVEMQGVLAKFRSIKDILEEILDENKSESFDEIDWVLRAKEALGVEGNSYRETGI